MASGNFCTLNPIAQLGTSTDASTRAGSMSNGNVKYVNLTGNTAVGTFGVTSGKWYFEVYINSFNADNGMTIGWVNDLFNLDAELGYNSPSSPSGNQAFGLYAQNQTLIYGAGDGSGTYNKSYGSGTPTDGDIIRIWLDADNGKFWGGLNGTIHNSGDPSAGTGHGFGTGGSPHNIAISSRTLYPAIGNWSGADATVTFNFGQDSTFGGAISAGTEVDGNGFGNFKYSTEGFLALCSANVPISADIDPAGDDGETENPTKQFGIVTYTGNGGSNAITGLGFQPDLVWAKSRSSAQNHILIDSSRGQGLLFSSVTNAEQTSGGPFMTSYDSDGFTYSSSGSNANDSGQNYVAWCWRANGGTTASNSDGDITSTVQANTKAGFSIVTYTGNRTGTGVSTVGHGLDSAPDMVITKSRSDSGNWWVQHTGTSTASKMLNLQSTNAETDKSGNGTLSRPTATVFGTNFTDGLGTNGQTHVAYCWHNVEGFQKFGSYVGNYNTDGSFIYTGFRPRMLFVKRLDATNSWFVWDTARTTFNKMNSYLYWDLSNAEETGYAIDVLSNGFKLKGQNNATNNNGGDFIYGAWGDVPFKYNNTF